MGRTLRLAAAGSAVAVVLGACGGASSGAVDTSGSAGGTASAAKAGLRLVKVGSFSEPVYVTSPPKDERRLYVVERAGRIRVVQDGRIRATPFLDIRSQVESGGTEQGLLSVAFAPDYAQSKRFYVYFTDDQGQQRVVEYRAASPGRADPASGRLVMRMADRESNHNGGLLLFGPDGHLYIGTGDGGGSGDEHGPRGNAQNLSSPLGKILRIDPAEKGGDPYSVPSDNPFVGRAGARPEVYAYGLRNPWRYSFDRKTGDLSIGDVGQNEIEEIDFVRRGKGRGANFGWRVFEGRSRHASGEAAPGAIAPVITTKHSDGNCSITGGVVVRDPRSPLAGRYVYGDFCRGKVLSATLARPKAKRVRSTGLSVPSLSSFGEDARGRVYLVSLQGPVYRLGRR
jgi:glucose/arabinose dehydrogenase